MEELKDIRDDQIRIIGEEGNKNPVPRNVWIFILSILGLVIIGVIIFIIFRYKEVEIQELGTPGPALFEPVREAEPTKYQWIGSTVDSLRSGYIEIVDTLINDIPIKIFIPHNAELSLYIGRLNKEDKSVIYAAQAADVRADNGGVVGAFVLNGEPRSWGVSKKGYCASINGKVTIGVAENSPLFEKATEEGGYFFRQYPLVSNGEVIDNEPKGKSIRRAICDRQGEIFMVETGTKESFHDFAQALADLGVDQAIYLVGSSAYGWAVDKNDNIYEFGEDNYYKDGRKMPKHISYIVWKRK
ncbi:phosphodiester glycosidase family protein [Bacteroides pyogenes]|uniref:Phosphodiester glycosidase family protein n=1 Tax=Bacteroides pyogenes TaxID=310300 RepID=A0A5D3E875_9BACE|nr:phosphodiester glycosidase family protein [Bacteroides pyogenes]TYK31801.1 phosphodiester glycosidase family protein [Bacteroides pyogenes]TYK43577.1 phosphodiester glycosidase family protein [Bacteroides pyogenes]